MALESLGTIPEDFPMADVWDSPPVAELPAIVVGRRALYDELIWDQDGGFTENWRGRSSLTGNDIDGYVFHLARRAFGAQAMGIFVGGTASGGSTPTGPAGGDLAGSYPDPHVVALNEIGLQEGVPDDGQVMAYNEGGGFWEYVDPPTGDPTMGGDVSGPASAATVDKLKNIVLDVTGAATGKVITHDGTKFVLQTPAAAPTLSGDVSGSLGANTVDKVKNVTVDLTGASDGKVFTYRTSPNRFALETPAGGGPPSGSAGGDLSGTYPNPTVAKVQGTSVDTTAPTDGQVLTYETASTKAKWKTPSGGGGGGSTPGVYVGKSSNASANYVTNSWADIHAGASGWVDVVQDNITRSSGDYTVAEAGYYLISASFCVFGIADFYAFRATVNGTVGLMREMYSPSSSAVPDNQLVGVVYAAAGAVINVQYTTRNSGGSFGGYSTMGPDSTPASVAALSIAKL